MAAVLRVGGGEAAGHLRSLVDHLRGCGGMVHPALAFAADSTGEQARAVAVSDVSAGEPLLRVPLQYTLRCDSEPLAAPARTGLDRLIGEVVPASQWQTALGLRLLHERVRGEESPWSRYIHALPMSFPGVPLFFNQEALLALQSRPLIGRITARLKLLLALEQDLARTDSPLFPDTQVTRDNLGWAVAAVSSRAFDVGPELSDKALVPVMDLVNHSFSPNAGIVLDVPGKALVLESEAHIAANDEVTFSYGQQSNDEFLLDYGFFEENPHDCIRVSIGSNFMSFAASAAETVDPRVMGLLADYPPSHQDSRLLTDWKIERLATLGFTDPLHTVVLRADSQQGSVVDHSLKQLARVLASRTPEDLDRPMTEQTLVVYQACLLGAITALQFRCLPGGSNKTLLEEADGLRGLTGDLRLASEFCVSRKLLFARAATHLMAE